MSRNKVYLIFVDILGFDLLAKEISEKKDIETRDVRNKFISTIESKLDEAGKENLLIGIAPGRDDWILAVESKQKVFYVISKILDHYTGYIDYKTIPLEIAIGIEQYDKWARLNGNELIFEDNTIKYLKSNIIGKFHEDYKKNNNNESVKGTFIIIMDSFFNELSISDQDRCEPIQYGEDYFYSLPESIIERERKITNFLKEIRQKRSDFSGALIDKIFIPPDGYEQIKETLKRDRIVFITGTAGYGKTYTTIRLLWEYFIQEYTPRWMHGKDEPERNNVREELANIESCLESGHIIYFEDPFGKTKYEKRDDLKERINHIINTVKNEEDVYVIITSRKDVFEEFEKESYSVDQIKKFEQELNILRPAYNNEKRKEMLEKWAIEKECKWLKDRKIKEFAFKSIESQKNLPIPHSIHDFVESTINTTDLDELQEEIIKYSGSAENAFADEIKGLYESNRKDRVLFLSFIFISEDFKINFVKKEYNKMKCENDEDFEKILKEESRVKEWSAFDEESFDSSCFDTEKHLEFSHPSYSESIKYILKHPGCKKIFWEVVVALLNKGVYIRGKVVEKLGAIGDPQAVELLIKSLEDLDSIVRSRAAEALGEIGDPRAVKPLIQILEDKDKHVRNRTAESLGKIGDQQAVTPLIKTLMDKEWNVREMSAQALGEIRDPRAVPALIHAINDGESTVRMEIVWALGQIKDPKAVEPLIKRLNDPSINVRKEAVISLEKMGDPQAIPYLIQTQKGDPDVNVRKTAGETLKKFKNPSLGLNL